MGSIFCPRTHWHLLSLEPALLGNWRRNVARVVISELNPPVSLLILLLPNAPLGQVSRTSVQAVAEVVVVNGSPHQGLRLAAINPFGRALNAAAVFLDHGYSGMSLALAASTKIETSLVCGPRGVANLVTLPQHVGLQIKELPRNKRVLLLCTKVRIIHSACVGVVVLCRILGSLALLVLALSTGLETVDVLRERHLAFIVGNDYST